MADQTTVWEKYVQRAANKCATVTGLGGNERDEMGVMFSRIIREQMRAAIAEIPKHYLPTDAEIEAAADILWGMLDLNGHTREGVNSTARAALLAASRVRGE